MERNIISKVSKGYLAVDLRFRHRLAWFQARFYEHLTALCASLFFGFDKNNKTTVALQINIQFNESFLFKIYEVRVLSFRQYCSQSYKSIYVAGSKGSPQPKAFCGVVHVLFFFSLTSYHLRTKTKKTSLAPCHILEMFGQKF